MSKKGPRRKAKPSSSHPQVPMELDTYSDLFQLLMSFEDKANDFIRAASEHDPKRRNSQIQLFKNKHPEINGKAISGFLGILLEVLQSQSVNYLKLKDQHAKIVEKAKSIQPSQENAFLEEFTKTNRISEPQFLNGYAKANILEAFLTTYLASNDALEPALQESRQLILTQLFVEVSQANSFLINRYLMAQLTLHDYYFYYQALCEKVDWLLLYGLEYQENLFIQLSENPNINNSSWYDSHFLLQFYKDSVALCILVKQDQKVALLKERLENLLIQLALRCAKAKHEHAENLEEAITSVYSQKNITESQQNEANNNWLIFYFRQLDNLLNIKNVDTTSEDSINEETFQKNCESCRQTLIMLIKNEHQAADRIKAFYDILVELKYFSLLIVPHKRTTCASESALLNLLIGAMQALTKCETNSFISLTIKAAFKRIADELKEKLLIKPLQPITVESKPLPMGDVERATVALSALVITPSVSAAPENNLAAMQAVKDDELNKEKRKLDKKLAKERKKQNRNYEKDKAALEETHRQQMVELQSTHEKAKKQYIESLQLQLTSLKSTFENEIATRRQQLADQAQQSQTHLSERTQTESGRLKAKHARVLQHLEAEHARKLSAQLEKLESEHQRTKNEILTKQREEIVARKAQLLSTNSSKIEPQRRAHEAEISLLKIVSKPKSAIADAQPFTQIELPPEVRFIMSLLEKHFECYLSGGWVRNRLRGLQPCPEEDFDLIVNAIPEELPHELISQCTRNPLQPNLLKLGKLEFWCVPWEDLRLDLLKRDFTINTFICTSNGRVYDLLSVKDDLNFPLKILGIAKVRYEADPTLILRHIRFSNQLRMRLTERDIKYLKKASRHLTKLPVSHYLSSLQTFFQCQSGVTNYVIASQLGILSDLFSFLPKNSLSQLVNDFWISKIQHFIQFNNFYNHYHLLALFMLSPILLNEGKGNSLEVTVEECLDTFFNTYQAGIDEADRIKIRKTIIPILLNKPETANEGEFGLFWQLKSFIQFNTQRNPTFTPLFQMGQHLQTPHVPSPATQAEQPPVKNGMFLG